MDCSLQQYLKVGVDYTAKGSTSRAVNQFQEIKETAGEKQVEESERKDYWQEVETTCHIALKKIDAAGDDPDYPELGKKLKQIFEDRLDMDLPDIPEKKLEKGRRRSERKERQERMQNRDVKKMLGGKSPPPSRSSSGGEEEEGISYKDGVGQEEKQVTESSTSKVIQDRIEFLEDEVRRSQEDLMEMKEELDDLREEQEE